MKKVLVIFGTRPEAIKMCPVVKELKKRYTKFETVVCTTGQHKEMLQQVLDIFNIVPDYNLNIMKDNQDLFDISSNIFLKMRELLDEVQPDIVLVHGDTTTACIAAISAFYKNIPVGHVEAGLRTNNLNSPFPEEFNRKVIDMISLFRFCPTIKNACNILEEEPMKKEDTCFVVGNTIIDALQTTVKKDYKHPILDWAKDSRLIFLTAHRRENIGENMKNIFSAVNNITKNFEDVKVVYPVHKNPAVRELANEYFASNDKVKLIEPLDIIDCHNIMSHSYLVVTDSGGIQEEAPSLNVPIVVVRDTTERPEIIECGAGILTGIYEKEIYFQVSMLLEKEFYYNQMKNKNNPYGDGTSAKQIATILELML